MVTVGADEWLRLRFRQVEAAAGQRGDGVEGFVGTPEVLRTAGRCRGSAEFPVSPGIRLPGWLPWVSGYRLEWTLVEQFSPLRFRMKDSCAGVAACTPWADGELSWVAAELSWGRFSRRM